MSADLLKSYYDAFNRGDAGSMLGLVTDDIVHEPCQGAVRHGKPAFADFLEHMNRCYKERVIDPIFLVGASDDRAAAEFMLEGSYLEDDSGLPAAHGQRYALRVGAFFEVREGKIARITNHYNLAAWLSQVE
ncbi:MAG: cytosolic protein [Sphingobium sp.]|nr:cytosolic protein [Sphingobium sp.]